ncbi:MAG: GntR family transcriptional regulator [Eubacterium sp.]
MAWSFKNDRPIYTQLLEQIEQKIISGEYPAGSRVPSVRELAAEAAVNPNTMQRAMAELENRGLIITNRTSGRMVTEDAQILVEMKNDKALGYTEEYMGKMTELGYGQKEIIELIKKGENE